MTAQKDEQGRIPSLPLSGIRVLDIGHVVAAPFCSMLLADAGAEVIKVERPRVGETSRTVGPFLYGQDRASSGTFVRMNRSKKGLTLNLKSPQGKAIFKDLVKKSDVVVENFSPGTLEKLGLGYESVLKPANPRLIFASINGFGGPQSGPYWSKPAFNLIAQAMGGIMEVTGAADGPPAYCGVPIGDLIPAMLTAWGISLAIRSRDLTGEGQAIEVAMYDSLVWLCERVFNVFQYTKKMPVRGHDAVVCPHGAYKARDGFFVVDVYTHPEWVDFCKLMGKEELKDHPEYCNGPQRSLRAGYLREIIETWAADKTKFEAAEAMAARGIPAAPIQNIQDILSCPHLEKRDMLVRVKDPVAGDLIFPHNPVRFSGTDRPEFRPAPLLGEHTHEILRHLLGMSDGQIEQYQKDGVV